MELIFNFFLCLFILFPPILILISLKGKKPYKVKEDILFIEKQFNKCILLSTYLILFLYEILKRGEGDDNNNDNINEDIKSLFTIKIYMFNIYIVLLFMNNFFLCIEDYLTYINPIHYFNSLINKSKYNLLYEIISISISMILFAPNLLDQFNQKLNDYLNIPQDNDYQNQFIILNIITLISTLIINIIILILYIKLKIRLKKIIFKAREKLFRILKRKIIYTISYIIFLLFNIFLFYMKTSEYNKICRIINSYLFLFVYIIDTFLEFKTYSTSKFTQYKLKYTFIESIGNCLKWNKEEEEDRLNNNFLESIIQEDSRFSKNNNSIDDDDEDNSLLMPITTNDIDLVLIYRNNIFIEDYFFYYYDFIMNITLCSLFKIYKDKKFSPSVLKNNQLKNELNITESAIFGGEKSNIYMSNYSLKKIDTADEDNSTYCTKNSNIDKFEFFRNAKTNDFFYAEEIFANNNSGFSIDDIKVNITSYYTSKCVSNILDKNFTSKIISDSLKSHLNTNYNNGYEEPNAKINKNNISSVNNNNLPFHSIISCNAKEEYFLHLNNMTIKTYDKQLIFDIFESNDDDINIKTNKKLIKMLDQYFNYIKGVGVSGTFLPIILGIFKVKINSFKTMLIFITSNSLIENSPTSTYSYWQLIRFSPKDTKKVGSSKYRHNELIGDDLIFDRKFALPSIKEENDSSYNTIEVKNYMNFEETIKHDITFLNKCQIKDTHFLLMYFEYENAHKHELGGAIKIKKINTNKAEIINTTVMPIFKDDDESDDNIYLAFSKKQDSEVATIPTIPEVNKQSNDISNRISVTSNIKINDNKKENQSNKKDNKEIENDNINENLDISKSLKNKESSNDLKKTVTANSRIQSICGSLSNVDFFDEQMMSFDDAQGGAKNLQGSQNHNMLNYSEKIKMNSYEGYFDSFNCMCLFSFDNIFNLEKGCCCNSYNYNQLQNNVLHNFSHYIPRKHTVITKPTINTKNNY